MNLFELILRCFFLTLLFVCVCSCSDNDIKTDGDIDHDADRIENEADPCEEVDCSPGTCGISYGYAKCNCPTGYEISGYSCVAVTDGDEDNDTFDSDTEQSDTSDTIEQEGCVVATEGIFKDIPCCANVTDTYPCMAELEIEYTSDKGEFRIGFDDTNNLYILGVWQNIILYKMSNSEDTGLYLYFYNSRKSVRLGSRYARTLNGFIKDNSIIWEETEEINSQDMQLWGSLWTSSLDKIDRTKLPTSQTAKYTQRIYEDNFYWMAINEKAGEGIGHIYTINDNGEEEQLDQSSSNVGYFTVYDKTMVWFNSNYQLVKFDLENRKESLIANSPWALSTHSQTKDKIYFSDRSDSPHPEYDCGWSIREYDLTTTEHKTIKANVGMTDYFVEDVWEDWLVYANCNEGEPGIEDEMSQCCLGGGNADIYLRQLSTGDEWQITDTFGEQVSAKMWGPLIVWRDGRHRDNGEGKALYGIDLCKHPELKDKFEECTQ